MTETSPTPARALYRYDKPLDELENVTDWNEAERYTSLRTAYLISILGHALFGWEERPAAPPSLALRLARPSFYGVAASSPWNLADARRQVRSWAAGAAAGLAAHLMAGSEPGDEDPLEYPLTLNFGGHGGEVLMIPQIWAPRLLLLLAIEDPGPGPARARLLLAQAARLDAGVRCSPEGMHLHYPLHWMVGGEGARTALACVLTCSALGAGPWPQVWSPAQVGRFLDLEAGRLVWELQRGQAQWPWWLAGTAHPGRLNEGRKRPAHAPPLQVFELFTAAVLRALSAKAAAGEATVAALSRGLGQRSKDAGELRGLLAWAVHAGAAEMGAQERAFWARLLGLISRPELRGQQQAWVSAALEKLRGTS